MKKPLVYLICALGAYLVSASAVAEETLEPSTESAHQYAFAYEVGLNSTYLNADDYFELNTSNVESTGSSVNLGADLGMFISSNKLPENVSLGFEWTKTGSTEARVASLCNSAPCTRTTSLEHRAVQMNAYYEALSQDAFSLSVFGGLSHVWAEGEIKDQAWSQSAFGQQLGLKAYFLKGRAAQPYAGLRVLHYQIEQNSSTINLYNWGLVLGARF